MKKLRRLRLPEDHRLDFPAASSLRRSFFRYGKRPESEGRREVNT